MTIYVRRGLDGAINLISSAPYEDENGPTTETLDDNDPELSAFRSPVEVTVLYPVDLWSRMTDGEADAVVQAMGTQTVRIQNIFRSASSFRSDHELWPLLVAMATNLFGEVRAAEILATS
jgi:hypothetical protein